MKQNFYVIIVILSMTVLSSSINAKSMGINVCNGYVRIQENSQDEISNEEKCMFVDNFILQKIEEPEIQSGVPFGNIYNKVIYCKDSDGIMTDYTGIVAASTLVKLMGRLVHVKYVDEE